MNISRESFKLKKDLKNFIINLKIFGKTFFFKIEQVNKIR